MNIKAVLIVEQPFLVKVITG